MDRKNFLKKIGLVFGAGLIVPKVWEERPAKEEEVTYTKGLLTHLSEENKTYYTSAYSLGDFDEVWAEYKREFASQVNRNTWRVI